VLVGVEFDEATTEEDVRGRAVVEVVGVDDEGAPLLVLDAFIVEVIDVGVEVVG